MDHWWEKIKELMAKIKIKFGQLISNVRAVVMSEAFRIIDTYGVIADWILKTCDRIKQWVERIIAEIELVIDNPGDPAALNNAATIWTTSIGKEMGAYSESLTLSKLRVDDHWKGVSADAYKESIPDQVKAFESFRDDLAGHVSAGLNTFADGLSNMYSVLGGGLMAFAIQLVAAIVLICFPLTAPGGVGLLITAVVTLLGVEWKALSDIDLFQKAAMNEFQLAYSNSQQTWPTFSTS